MQYVLLLLLLLILFVVLVVVFTPVISTLSLNCQAGVIDSLICLVVP